MPNSQCGEGQEGCLDMEDCMTGGRGYSGDVVYYSFVVKAMSVLETQIAHFVPMLMSAQIAEGGLLDCLTVGRTPTVSTQLAPLNVNAILVGMFSKVELDVLRISMNAQMEGVGRLACHIVDRIQTVQTMLVHFPVHVRWATKTGLKILAVRTLMSVG